MKIGAKLAVTMAPQGVIKNPLIEVKDRKIVSVTECGDRQTADVWVDGIILPGLISTHTHLHGLVAYGHPVPAPAGFWPFLKQYWWPLVEDVLRADDVENLVALASLMHLKNGFTCFCDVMEAPYAEPGFMQREIEAIEATGARAFVSNEATERAGAAIAEKLLKENEAILGKSGRVQGMMSVHTTFSCSSTYIQKAKAIAKKNDAIFQLHVSEGEYHVKDTLERFGKRPVNYLRDLGVLDEKTLASQCVHLQQSEIEIMAETGTKISHNPVSNMEIGAGSAPLAAFLDAGADVSLGDDGFVRAMDPFVNMSTALFLHSLLTPGRVGAEAILALHTTKAADALHLDAGMIAPGKAADLVVLRNRAPTPLLAENAIYHLVVGALGRDVSHVVVDGDLVYADGEFTSLDEQAITRRSMETIKKLWKR